MKDQFFYAPSESQMGDTEAYVALGVAALMMVGLAMSAVLDLGAARDEFAGAPPSRPPAIAQTAAAQPKRQETQSIAPSPCATGSTTGTPQAAAVTVPASFTRPGAHSRPVRVINF